MVTRESSGQKTYTSSISIVNINGVCATKKFLTEHNYLLEKKAYKTLKEWKIPHVLEVGRTDDERLTIEFPIAGEDLHELICKKEHNFPRNVKSHIVRCVVETLDCLHKRKHVYLDLKLENVLYDKDTGKVSVIDFTQIRDVRDPKFKVAGGITKESLAPEFYIECIGLSFDVWCLGIFMAELFGIQIKFRFGFMEYTLKELNDYYCEHIKLGKLKQMQVYSQFVRMIPVVHGEGKEHQLIRQMVQPNHQLRPSIESVLLSIKEL